MKNDQSEMTGLELEQVLASVAAKYRSVRYIPKHLELLSSWLLDFANTNKAEYTDLERESRIMEVVNAACKVTNVPVQKLLHYNRSYRRLCLVRQVAMYVAREYSNASFPTLGKVFGRHHATVIYACQKVAEMMKQPGHARTMVTMMRNALERKEQAA